MKPEYVGNNCITLERFAVGRRRYSATLENSPTPRETKPSDCGKGDCYPSLPRDLIRVYTRVNDEAFKVVNEAVTRANRGQEVDFEHLLD